MLNLLLLLEESLLLVSFGESSREIYRLIELRELVKVGQGPLSPQHADGLGVKRPTGQAQG